MFHRRSRPSFLPALLLLVAVCLVPAGVACADGNQGSGIKGTVLDPDGKLVVDAIVLIRSEATGSSVSLSTDGNGSFSSPDLKPGLYSIEVAVAGFDIVRKASVQSSLDHAEAIEVHLTLANIAEQVTVRAALPAAAAAAPSQGSLEGRSAQSLISNEYIRSYTSPISDYSQVLAMAPGTFSVASNGPGLGDTKTFFRGFKDGNYNMTFDGIPFNDTNDPTHHSWVFFPAQTIGSTVFDRSPGSAAVIGPATYGGTVNLLSRSIASSPEANGTFSFGSFNTRLFDLQLDSGRFGGEKSRLLVDFHHMDSDGYQTYNDQRRNAFSAKYEYAPSDKTAITLFSSVLDLRSHTPNQKGATRGQIAQFGDRFLMNADPTSPLFYQFNFYHIPTNFEYFGVRTDLGHGWTINNKIYTMRYNNKQNYNSTTAISATSATDKLNSYWKVGNYLPLEHASTAGIVRLGLWSEYASTDRYQTPSDPRTWVDALLPNFHEMFGTTTIQPYAEFQFKATSALSITPGLKYAYYKQDFTQLADGKTVGNLNGAASVKHAASYKSWLPSVDAHYRVQENWSAYAQFGRGQTVPPTKVFDVKNGEVGTLPKPTLADTAQAGTVWKSRRATLDVNVFHIRFESDYSSTFNQQTGQTDYFTTGESISQGIEAESTILVGGGLALYLNGTTGSAKYSDTKQWVQNAPSNTETIGFTYNRGPWNVGFFGKRVGPMFNDNGNVHQAVPIDPFNVGNLFLNYTVGGTSRLAHSRLRLAINNMFDTHAITGVTPALTTTSVAAPGDILTLMAGRSVSVSLTVGVAGKP